MKKTKKIFKISLIIFLTLFLLCLSGGIIFFHITTNNISLNADALNQSQIENQISIYDQNGKLITKPQQSYIKITKLSNFTKDAFICAEDKRFYSHNGIDFIRMAKAILSNIKSRSFSQGASTISQQLIKNTQLSNEKTLKRKIKEIKLTTELENKYSKNEILEMYLNNIYFGNGCYGIESASQHYFSKSASNLALEESALLAAIINAPSIYDPENDPSKAKERRNLILDLMQNNNKINEKDCNNAKNRDIVLKIQNLTNNNFLFNEIINEACNLLNTTPNDIANKKLKIFTNINLNLVNKINNLIKSTYSNIESTPDIATIIIDNYSNKIISITGKKSVFTSKKQPGSTIKPILVFAPAIEKGQISPATKILDEPINISGYSPLNSNGKYHGFVSVREALKNSYNIPAVKILNELGINCAQDFAKKLGIEFSENDNNLAIALGGFTDGITLKSIADAYTAFANKGEFSTSSFITKIIKNNKTIYESSPIKNSVMQQSTAYLITNMLIDTSTSGTAKRLKDFPFEIASKTGTVGQSNTSKNKEAFNISYTTEHTILTYVGGTIMPENINGSTYPTMITKDILQYLYNNHTPKNFTTPASIQKINLNKNDYENNILSIEKNNNDYICELFNNTNLPTNNTSSYKIEIENSINNKPIIKINNATKFSFQIIRKYKNEEEIISPSLNSNYVVFEDKTAKSNEIYEYFARFCDFSNNSFDSNHITIKSY